jgi:hypothetical protein
MLTHVPLRGLWWRQGCSPFPQERFGLDLLICKSGSLSHPGGYCEQRMSQHVAPASEVLSAQCHPSGWWHTHRHTPMPGDIGHSHLRRDWENPQRATVL